MVRVYEELLIRFEDTIIDIETIGDFDESYDDYRRYRNSLPVLFGYIANDGLKMYYVEKEKEIGELKQKIIEVLPRLKTPLYAFNCEFETGVLFHSCGQKVKFDCELNQEKYEWKGRVVKLLGLDSYNDPFNDVGKECKKAWLRGEIKRCIRHNRSCLLKERDILLKRGSRKPDDFALVSI
jgi:hypothetical protein